MVGGMGGLRLIARVGIVEWLESGANIVFYWVALPSGGMVAAASGSLWWGLD